MPLLTNSCGEPDFQAPVWVIIEDPFLSPGPLPGDHLILIAGQRMKRMGNTEPAA
jgi:hypothetical protein